LIGREATALRLFPELLDDLKLALSKVHAARAQPERAKKADDA
jgi:hypothetical protein